MVTTEKCSKNYINCRRHPARKGLLTKQLLMADLKELGVEAAENYRAAETAYENARADKTSRPGTVGRLARERNKAWKSYAALDTPFYTKYMADVEAKKSLVSKAERNEVEEIEKIRNDALNAIRKHQEKEVFYAGEATPLTDFQKAVSKLFIREGDAFNPEDREWGTSLGGRIHDAKSYFEGGNCEIYAIEDFQDDYAWSVYDTVSSDQRYGLHAKLSCNCGHYYKQNWIYEGTFSAALSSLINTH